MKIEEKINLVSSYTKSFDIMKRSIGDGWPKEWRCRCISCKSGGFTYAGFGDTLEESLDNVIHAHNEQCIIK